MFNLLPFWFWVTISKLFKSTLGSSLPGRNGLPRWKHTRTFDLVILNKSHTDDFCFFTNTFPEVYRSKFRHCCWCLSGLCTFFSGQSARSNIQLPLTQLANGVHAAECGSHPSQAPSVHCSISVCFLFRLCDILKDWHGSTRGCACVHIYINIYI